MLSAAVLRMNMQYNGPLNAHLINDLRPSTFNLPFAEFSNLKSQISNQKLTYGSRIYPTKILAKTSKAIQLYAYTTI